MPLHYDDISGKVFGRLTAVWPCGRIKGGILWQCFCSCGNSVLVSRSNLARTHSCGCLKKETQLKHGGCVGGRKSAEYTAYHDAKRRCSNPRHARYADWGGRGIRFEFKSFEEFYAEIGPRPSPDHSLDRIENDGHYTPGNIHWATAHEQRINQRRRSK